jgi:GT2 family glycosyltransferase
VVAQGDILCFIDDDAVALSGWLEAIRRAFFEHPHAGVIGGHIALSIPQPRPRVLTPGSESYWGHFETGNKQFEEVRTWPEFPWGGNWCARRKALLDIGGFPLHYGRSGDNSWGGEELVAACQIQRLGYEIGIEPGALVLHEVDSRRYTLGHIWRAILADLMVRYQATKDGFLEGSVYSLLAPPHSSQKLRHLFMALIDFSSPWESKFALLMRALARLALFFYIARDKVESQGFHPEPSRGRRNSVRNPPVK